MLIFLLRHFLIHVPNLKWYTDFRMIWFICQEHREDIGTFVQQAHLSSPVLHVVHNLNSKWKDYSLEPHYGTVKQMMEQTKIQVWHVYNNNLCTFSRFQLEGISGGFIFTMLLGKYEKKTLNFVIQAFSASFAKKKMLWML